MYRSLAVAALLLVAATAQPAEHLITYLPGAPAVNFRQYSGYININATTGRNLFYWYTESQNDPKNDPLVLWFNGGPGCSSLEGLLTENGPFIINKDGKTLRANPYSWNTVANVLYLESPSGVGFSRSDDRSDYTVGDERTAYDAWVFVTKFLELYPYLQNAPLWISGESYAGHYVPNLALEIINQNKNPANPKINLAGFQVGNPWTIPEKDNEGAAFFWYSHSLISTKDYRGMMDNCDFATVGPLRAGVDPVKCNQAINSAQRAISDINIYNIFADVCLTEDGKIPVNSALHFQRQLAESGAAPHAAFLPALERLSYTATTKDIPQRRTGGNDPDPCIDAHITAYLNQPEVQKAIHASISYPWTVCSAQINYSRRDLFNPMTSVYQALIAANPPIKMLLYSGDIDAIVPVTGTRYVLDHLNLTLTELWRPWYGYDKQVGGWVEAYKELTFASIREAGHMVPYNQPERSHALFLRFLRGEKI